MTEHSLQRPAIDSVNRNLPPEIGGSLKQCSVLVVDDEDAVRQFLKRGLEAAGYLVTQASGAAAALAVMMSHPAAVVLCDVRMPGEDGLWLAEQLRARWPRTAVVMTTAIDDLHTVTRSRDLGVADYVTKPIKLEHLIDVVQRVSARSVGDAAPALNSPGETPHHKQEDKVEAEYTLESPVRCPACGERLGNLKAIRMVRAHVNFTSTLPRRGRVLACPHCLAIVPAELTNF